MSLFRPSTWNWLNGPTVQQGTQSPVVATGGRVSFDVAMTISAYWASARLLSETVAAMPIRALRKKDGSRKHDPSYRLWRLLNFQPNRYQTRTEFFEVLMLNLVTWGNWYTAIERDATGEIISLIPLMSSQMKVDLLKDGTIIYTYSTGGNIRVFAAESIWHVKLFGNGIVGLSTLAAASGALGIAKNLNKRIDKLAANAGKPAGVLMVDKKLNQPQRNKVKENFKEMQEGDADQLFVLEAQMTYEQLGLSPSDMQLLENRKYQVEDIARFMGVPSVLINDTSGTTAWGTGISEINMGFYKLNLRPYLERIETSIKRWLMDMSDWDEWDIEFDFDALLRADRATRIEANSKAINSGQLTPNEVRNSEGLESKTGGDKIYINGTLQPAGAQLIGRPQNAN